MKTITINDIDDFEIGDTVDVSEPIVGNEVYNHNFTGKVVGKQDNYLIVKDQDDDCYSIEPENCKKSNSDED